MSKETIAKRKKEILADIADPKVREHYRLQLDEAEQLEEEGVATAFHEVFQEERREDERVEGLAAEERIATAAGTAAHRRLRRDIVLGVALGIVLAAVVVWLLGKL